MSWITRTCFFVLIFASVICLKVTFERGSVTYVNYNYLVFAYGNVTRFGRKGEYYMNIIFETRYLLDDNVTVNILFYELWRNQYRRSFIEFHNPLCDFLNNEPYVGMVARVVGLRCPLRPHRKYALMKLTTHLENFPFVFPFEKGRMDFSFNATSNGESIAQGVLYVTFKNGVLRKKNG